MKDFTKEFFQRSWGEHGYFETFSYGVGINKVCEITLNPFYNLNHHALEIGPGGGAFTQRMVNKFKSVTAIDVIKMPVHFSKYNNLRFIELPSNSYDCQGIPDNSIDFCFCYNVFCHLSDEAIEEYLENVNRALKPGGNFIFMLSKFSETEKHLPKDHGCQLGELTPTGHFYQNEYTLPYVMGEGWIKINSDMIPEHRDIIIHLKKHYHVQPKRRRDSNT